MLNEILATKGPLLIRASAGTGKTYTLTQKVIHLILQEQMDVEEILALTFTDFAAAEMRERIYSAITKTLEEETDPQKRRHLERQRVRFYRNQISTFHSFCFNLIRSYPDVAGLETEIRLMDSFQEAQFNLELRSKFYQTHKEHSPLVRMLMRFGQRNVESLCKEMGDVSEARLREMIETTPAAWLEMAITQHEQMIARRDAHYASLRSLAAAHRDLLKDSVVLPETYPLDFDTYFNKSNGALSASKAISKKADPDVKAEAVRISIQMNAERDRISALGQWLQKDEADLLKELSDPDAASIDPDTVSFHSMRDLADLILLWRSFFRDERHRTGKLIFDDLIHLVHQMTRSHPDWLATLRGRYRTIVVDEFQDTDAVQWEILSAMMNDDMADILLVGDVKQAIYEFRGGNVSVMQRVAQELQPTEFKLGESWRSTKEIVNGLNRLFTHVLRKTSDAIYEAEPQDLAHPGPHEDANNEPGSIRQYTLPTQFNDKGKPRRWKAGERSDAEARSLAHFLKAVSDGSYRDANGVELYPDIRELILAGKKAVGILLPSRSNQWKFEQSLRDAGLTFSSFSGVGFYQSHVVSDALALIRFLSDAYQDLPCAAVFRSPFVGFSDVALVLMRDEGAPRELFKAVLAWQSAPHPELYLADRLVLETSFPWLIRLRRKVKTVRLSDILHEAFLERPYVVSNVDPIQTTANIQKLIRLVRELEQQGNGSLVDVDAFLTRQLDDEVKEKEGVVSDTGSIQFMTIHGSKGLEFPMVVLPGLGPSKPTDRGVAARTPRDIQDAETWIVPKGLNSEEANTYYGAMYHHIRDQIKLREVAEQKRMFYVACTRARNHLVLWGLEGEEIQENKGSLGALLPQPLPFESHEIGEHWISESLSIPQPLVRLPLGDREAVRPRLDAAARPVILPSKTTDDEDIDQEEADGDAQWNILDPRDAGNLIHKALEHSGWMQVEWPRIERLVRRQWPHPDVDKTDLESVMAHVRRAVESLAARYPSPRLRRHEVAFEADVPDMGLLKGIIDLLIQDEAGAWHIVDFKTGSVQAHLEVYRTQLRLYREALLSLGVDVSSMSLLETETGVFVEDVT